MSTKRVCCKAPISTGFGRLRQATKHEITAAGGITTIEDIQALDTLHIHAALGMAIYTGRLNLADLAHLKLH